MSAGAPGGLGGAPARDESTCVVAVAWLFEGSRSIALVLAVTTLASSPACAARATTVAVAASPGPSDPSDVPELDTSASPGGRGSLTVTSVAVSGPAFRTWIV